MVLMCRWRLARLWASCAALLLFASAAQADEKPLTPKEALARITVPAGFHVSLFAGEPDVVQPIAMTIDDRGRLWVIECLSYPDWDKQAGDRVVIFEDTDGDGRFDRRTVFLDNGRNLSGIELGFGGVWLCSTPNLVFVPDRNGDDKPDGPAEVVLDGWDLKAKHNVFNALRWGPDGWLWGCNGIMSNSLVGKPGAADAERVAINCGVWRYQPTRKVFEAVAHGTTNPLGLDFDDYGEAFITNCVLKHLWHVIPGAHFERMYGQDFNAHAYSLMASCADHIHWGGGAWTESRGGLGKHDAPGGGHAHSGAMVYLGDSWPKEYRGNLFTCNIHGARMNQDVFERTGSGVVAHHGSDFFQAHDTWFRGVYVTYGPDGNVFVCDWHDTGECHDYDEVQRTNGRIYKVTYGKDRKPGPDLAKLSDAELVKLQLHANDFQVRHARRLLQERSLAGKLGAEVPKELVRMLHDETDTPHRLRALWALHATGNDADVLLPLTNDADAHLRGWAVRLLAETSPVPSPVRDRFEQLADHDPSPIVRLALASALQRLPLDERWGIAAKLIAHAEDASDQNLPLMIWYGIEPLAGSDHTRAVGLIAKAKIPLLREYLARRITE